ncbi:MAG: PUA domain-containing protein [Nitrososphaeria archaeon]
MSKFKLMYLSKREAREASEAISRLLKRELTPLATLASEDAEALLTKEGSILVALRGEGIYVPALVDSELVSSVPGYVVVDEGAVRHVVNGANVMRPGIVEYSGFESGDVVVVREKAYGKAIAVGIALMPSGELPRISKGPVVRNVHHLRDAAWELLRDEEVQRLIKKLAKRPPPFGDGRKLESKFL